eukprot:m.58318 g.58318  ORF g.58318 m.58318 type:complete len:54 (-) comp7859_c0_seq1:63-224(-)
MRKWQVIEGVVHVQRLESIQMLQEIGCEILYMVDRGGLDGVLKRKAITNKNII